MEGVRLKVEGVGWKVKGGGSGGTMRCCLAEDVAFPPSLDTPPEGYGCTGGRWLAWGRV